MKKSSAVTHTTTLIILTVFWIWASGASGADPKAVAAKVTDPKAVGQKAAEVKTAPQYKYNPAGKPDPFKPFIELDLAARQKLEKAKPLAMSPLQRAAIDQFRLVGISGDEKVRKAIVQDAKGKIYPLFTGTYVGLNNGRVVEILADRVIVEEKSIKSPVGKKTKVNRITMKLHSEEGEGKP
jgi:type IV pilus assembly protein PilP